MPALNYDDPGYQQAVRQRVQARLQPGAVGSDPTGVPAPPAPTAGYTNPATPQRSTMPGAGPPAGTTYAPNGAATLPDGTVLQAPAGMTRNPATGMLTPTPGTTPPTSSTFTSPLAVPQGNYQGVFDQLFPGETLTPQMLASKEADLARYGIKLNRNAAGLTTDLTLPDGTIVDPIQGAGSGLNRKQWLVQGASSGVAGSPTGTSNPFLDSIRSMLLQRLQADQQPVDENAPQIAQPYAAASLAAQRGQQDEQRQLSERLYAQGDLNSGALNQGIQQSAERNAVGLAGIKSGLIQKEYAARRADLEQNLQLAIASGDAQMAREVQLQLAALDATLRREGYGVSLAEFGQNQNALTANAGLNG